MSTPHVHVCMHMHTFMCMLYMHMHMHMYMCYMLHVHVHAHVVLVGLTRVRSSRLYGGQAARRVGQNHHGKSHPRKLTQ